MTFENSVIPGLTVAGRAARASVAAKPAKPMQAGQLG